MSQELLLHGPSNCIVCGEYYAKCVCGETGVNSSYYTDDELDGVYSKEDEQAEAERRYWECDYDEEYQVGYVHNVGKEWQEEDQSY